MDGRDERAILSPEVDAALRSLETHLDGRESAASEDLSALLARTHLERLRLLPEGRNHAEVEPCLKWFARVRRTNPSRVPDSIRATLDDSPFHEGWEEFGDPEWLSSDELDDRTNRLEVLFHQASTDPNPEGPEIDPATARTSQPDPVRAVRYASNLAAHLTTRYEQREHRPDLDRAIGLGRWIVASPETTGLVREAATTNLANALINLAEATSDVAALDEAVDLFATLSSERGNAADFANLAVAYLARFEAGARGADLDHAVDSARAAVRRTPPEDPSSAARLSNLGAALRAAFDWYADEDLLDEAVEVGREAVRQTRPEDLDVARRLTNLATSLTTRFERRRRREDIDESIDLGRRAATAGPATGHAARVANLASALHLRGSVYGRIEDLQEALALARATAQSLPNQHADRVDLLVNAAGTAMSWFDWTGDRAAVLASVELGEAAAAAAPDNPRGATVHSNLSMHLLTAFEATEEIDQLHNAYKHAQLGVERAGEQVGPIALSNLSLAARMLFEQLGSAVHLQVALQAAEEAIALCPHDHPDRSAYLSNLGLCQFRAGLFDEAVDSTVQAYEITDPCNATHAAYAANAARMLSEHPENDRAGRAHTLWREVAASLAAPTPLRIEGLVETARASVKTPLEAAQLYRQALALLPAAAWHGIDPQSRTRRLSPWQGLARDAAAVVLEVDGPRAALPLLDGSLSQLWSRDVPAATEIDALRHAHPDLADRFDLLRHARTAPTSHHRPARSNPPPD
ncbi:tetratricopeptide repeat protein [Nocardioides sp. 1609]|uniref:tetratricopeptide repeat protein n=1 Tax=Nocardioides sp. 1609 TaxID=2508327 RepID=UPI001431A9DE|nr:tetratricopeptide repeat protein [Nocardioides sp. 1609]